MDRARAGVLAAGRADLKLVAVHGERPAGARVGTVLTQKPAVGTALRSDGATVATLRYWSGQAKPARVCTPDALAPDLAGMEVDLAVRILRDFRCKPDLVLVPRRGADVPRLRSVEAGAPRAERARRGRGPERDGEAGAPAGRRCTRRAVVDRRRRRVVGATVTIDRGSRASDLVAGGPVGKVGIPRARGTGVLITQTTGGLTRYGVELSGRKPARGR